MSVMEDDIQRLRVKLSGLTNENKRYVIAVAEALFFAQSNGEVKKVIWRMRCVKG